MDEKINPWTTLESRPVYENNWISVREDSVIRPDGAPGIYGVVHFKGTATGVLALEDDDTIYLVGQYRYALGIYSWEIPEGGAPPGEDPLDAAKRELIEETGLTATHWQQIGTSHLSNSVCDENSIWYLATGLQQGKARPEGTEQLKVKRVPFDTALQMVLNGKITDAISIMAIQKYALMKQCLSRP